jgi:uncharacterized protein (TIGR03067 family)
MGRFFVWKLAIVGVLCAVAPELCLSDDKAALNEELIGTWEMERAVHGGPGSSIEEPDPLPNPTTLTFYEGWYVLQSPQSDKRFFRLRCHRDKNPHQFDVWFAKTEEEATAKTNRRPDAWGIYEMRGNHLWRCYANAKQERPNSFDVFGHEGWTLTVHRPGVER